MKVRLELQYFDGCPHHEAMRRNLRQAVRGFEHEVEYSERCINDQETAAKLMFRGSPTLLINGEDLEGMPRPIEGTLCCRVYPGGTPSAARMRQKIADAITANSELPLPSGGSPSL